MSISTAKIFRTRREFCSLFTVVREANEAANDMNHDLQLISQWAHDWRMSFNPDPQKQAVELVFSRKRNGTDHPVILFNNIPVEKVNEQKTFRYYLRLKAFLLGSTLDQSIF